MLDVTQCNTLVDVSQGGRFPKMSRTTLYYVLRRMGFSWELQKKARACKFLEKSDIVEKRRIFLEKKRNGSIQQVVTEWQHNGLVDLNRADFTRQINF